MPQTFSAPVKANRTILVIAAILILSAIAYVAFYSGGTQGNVDTGKLVLAVQRFSSEKGAAGVPLPQQISIRELVSLGYLEKQDVRGFEGMDVVISLDVDETHAEQVLLRARLPDGTVEALMGDGSVQRMR